LITVWVLTLGYVSAFAILHGGRGPGGHTGDQNDAAVVAAMGLSFALFGVGSADPKVRRISIILCAVFLVASIATLSRGGMIAMVSVALFYFLVTSHKFKKLIVIAIVIFGTFSFAPDQYFSEMASIDDDVKSDSQYSTVQIRLFMWATAINAFEDNPILGVGAANYTWVVGRYQPTEGNWPDSFFRRSRTGQAAHSWYFQILSEQGLVGVTVFGFLIFRFFRGLRRIVKQSVMAENRADDVWRFLSPKLLALALMGSMIGFLSAGVFLSILTYPHFYYLIGMGAGLELAVANREPDSQSGGEKLVSDRSASNGVDIQ